jgi:hypothetical protein
MKEEIKPLLPASRWCPMARVTLVDPVVGEITGNRFPAGSGLSSYWADVKCLTTACAVFVGDQSSGHCGLIRG